MQTLPYVFFSTIAVGCLLTTACFTLPISDACEPLSLENRTQLLSGDISRESLTTLVVARNSSAVDCTEEKIKEINLGEVLMYLVTFSNSLRDGRVYDGRPITTYVVCEQFRTSFGAVQCKNGNYAIVHTLPSDPVVVHGPDCQLTAVSFHSIIKNRTLYCEKFHK